MSESQSQNKSQGQGQGQGQGHVTLDLGGMTCATCAARIEKELNKVAGAKANVNFATEKA
ncbi:MAG: cation transporter, partial [Bacillota bacterium]